MASPKTLLPAFQHLNELDFAKRLDVEVAATVALANDVDRPDTDPVDKTVLIEQNQPKDRPN